MTKYDVIIIGAGAAGLAAAAQSTMRGRRTLVLDMGPTPGRKVAVSGGGRCNMTNMAATRDRYFGENPDFVRAALARVTPADILHWATEHGLSVTEKTPGQYFCAGAATDVVNALAQDARDAKIIQNTAVKKVTFENSKYIVQTDKDAYESNAVIVATGGISFPSLMVSDIGYKIAKDFGHRVIPPRPALCAIEISNWPSELAGISMDVEITINKTRVRDAILFTHFGIGGPAAYRATVRDMCGDMHINLMPDSNVYDVLCAAKRTNGRKTMASVLAEHMPARVAKWITGSDTRQIAQWRDAEIQHMAAKISKLTISEKEMKLHGMRAAEVVRGGVATDNISSKTMESRIHPGLFWAGEVLDIAGDLGGFNLHWAFASGRIAGQNA